MTVASHSQNKGEWSEFYAFLKILSTGRLHILDEDDLTSKELEVVRLSKNAHSFVPNESGVFRIIPGGSRAKPMVRHLGETAPIKECVAHLLAHIKASSGTFGHTESESTATQLGVSVKSEQSRAKGDLGLCFVRPDSGQPSAEHEVSVKSWLGGDPTLFNASHIGTRIIYSVHHVPIDVLRGLSQAKSKPRDTLKAISAAGGTVNFKRFPSAEMNENVKALRAGDTLAWLVKFHYAKEARGRTFMDTAVAQRPLDEQRAHKSALREFLRAAALGMTSSRAWDLSMSASDNYLLVDDTGELFCVLGRSKVEKFLFKLAYVDTPSTTRYDFGYPYETDGGWEIALNFQVRLAARNTRL